MKWILCIIVVMLPCFTDGFEFWKHLATKTAYYPQQSHDNYTTPPETCDPEPIFFNMMARHGSRLPTSGGIKALKSLEDQLKKHADAFPAEYAFLKNWTVPYDPLHGGNLADAGEVEHYDLAKRQLSSYKALTKPYYPQTYKIQTSQVSRTGRSGNSFAYSIFEDRGNIGKNLYQPFYSYSLTKDADNILRFFQSCKKYEFVMENDPSPFADRYSKNFGPIQRALENKLNVNGSWEISFADFKNMMDACAYDYAINNDTSGFCSLFSENDFYMFEYYNDLDKYWTSGYGKKIANEIACPLLGDFVEAFDKVIKEEGSYSAKLRFGHAETILPFVALLGLFEDDFVLKDDSPKEEVENRKWRTSLISPFAGNTVFLLYKCGENDHMIKVLHNEKEVILPACGELYCPYDKFKELFNHQINECDFDKICENNPSEDDDDNDSSTGLFIVTGLACFVVGGGVGALIFYIVAGRKQKYSPL